MDNLAYLNNNIIDLKEVVVKRKIESDKKLDRQKIKDEIKQRKSTEMKCLYNEDEIKSVYNVFKEKFDNTRKTYGKYLALRNLTMFVCSISIGLRGGDFCSLKWNDIFDDNWKFKELPDFIPEKTIHQNEDGTYRYKRIKLYWNSDFETALLNFYDWRKENYPSQEINLDDYIFVSRKGGNVGRIEWWRIVESARKEAGIEQKIGTHGLRKTMAHSYIENSSDKSTALMEVCIQLGHSSPKVTSRYACIEENVMKENRRKTSCIFV